MKQKNGFVQIKITNSIAELYIYPPEDEGLPVTVKDVENYLSKEGFLGWNRKAIDDAIKSVRNVGDRLEEELDMRKVV